MSVLMFVGMTHTDGGRNWQDVPQSHFPVSRHVGRVHMPVSLAGGLQLDLDSGV